MRALLALCFALRVVLLAPALDGLPPGLSSAVGLVSSHAVVGPNVMSADFERLVYLHQVSSSVTARADGPRRRGSIPRRAWGGGRGRSSAAAAKLGALLAAAVVVEKGRVAVTKSIEGHQRLDGRFAAVPVPLAEVLAAMQALGDECARRCACSGGRRRRAAERGCTRRRA